MVDKLKLAIVTDIHHGPTRYTKLGALGLPLLEQFRDDVSETGADLIVDLGDRITNIDHDADMILMREVMSVFDGMAIPREHLLGNHDLHHLSIAENEEILGRPLRSHSVDLKGRHLVFWQHDLSHDFSGNEIPTDSDLDWLRNDLGATGLPTIIFTHVPLNDGSMIGNFYFQNNVNTSTVPHTQAARKVIESVGNVVMCVAGHVHWNDSSTINGIRYLTLQSLTESFTTQDEATGAWAEIEVDDQVHWRAHGRDPLFYEAPMRGHNKRWAPPLPPRHILRQQENTTDIEAPARGVILDMDGVLFRGDRVVEGSADAVRDLQNRGIGVVCLTNNARRTPEDYEIKLRKLGIDVAASHIITSGVAVAHYLMAQGAAPKIHVAGSDVLRRMLCDAGAIESDDPDYVVAGIDLDLKISDLTPAVRHLFKGARLIASNDDAVIPTPLGPEPEAGPVVAFLEAASGCKAKIIGKPQAGIFDYAIERLDASRPEIIVIGDTLATDIAGANAAELRSILVASGNSQPDETGLHEPTARFPDLRAAVSTLIEGWTRDPQ